MPITTRPRFPRASASAMIVERAHVADYSTRVAAFQAAIDRDDELGMILRTHILIEQLMRDVVKRVAPIVHNADMSYNVSLAVVCATGTCDIDAYHATKFLAKLRNLYAHEGFDISEDDIRKLDKHVSRLGFVELPDFTKPKSIALRWVLFGLFIYWLVDSFGYTQPKVFL